jgi:hypothetical protein
MVPTPEVHLRTAGDGNEIAWWIGLSYSVIRRTIASSATSPTERRTGSGVESRKVSLVHSHARSPEPCSAPARVTLWIGHQWMSCAMRGSVVAVIAQTHCIAVHCSGIRRRHDGTGGLVNSRHPVARVPCRRSRVRPRGGEVGLPGYFGGHGHGGYYCVDGTGRPG